MDFPLISVVVPVYKVEKYLDKCIESIVKQTYKNLEIILVDDGSPDTCPAICEKWKEKDSRVKVIHKENGGLSSARNAGVKIARGEYIGFIDSDDYIDPEMYEVLQSQLTKTNADLAICSVRWVNEDNSPYTDVCKSPIKDEILDKNAAFLKLTPPDSFYYVTAMNKLYKRHILDKVSFPEGRIHEDEFTIHRFFGECERVVTVERELYFYVQRKNSIMHTNFSTKRLDAIEAFLDRYHYFKANGVNDVTFFALYKGYSALVYFMKQVDVFKYRKDISPYVRKLSAELAPNLRVGKLCLVYCLRYVAGIMDAICAKIRHSTNFKQR